jgi:hypothetical protein
MSLQNKVAANPFTGIAQQSINPDDYNFNKGTVAAVGGLIKGYQDKEEGNKLANFNNAMLDMANKGDVAGLQQLKTYAGQFRDATVQQKAFADASTIFDTTASTILLNEAEQKKQVGDLAGYQEVIAKAQSAGLSPKTLAPIQAKFGADLPVLTGTVMFKNALKEHDTAFDDINKGNIKAFDETFVSNPEYSKYFTNTNGRIIPNLIDPTNTAELTKQKQLEDSFYAQAAAKGAKPLIGDVDAGLTKLRKQLRSSNVPEDLIAKLTQSFATEAMQNSQLGPQLKAEEARLHALVDNKTATDLARLDARFKYTQKFTDTELAEASTAYSFKQDKLFDYINKNFDNTTWYSTNSGKAEIKRDVPALLQTKIPGTDRVPTPYEVKQALDILSTNPLFRDARVADMDMIKDTLVGVMKDGVVGKASLLAAPLAEIDAYYKDRRQIQASNTTEKFRNTGRLLGQAGVSDTTSLLTVDTPQAKPTTTKPVTRTTPILRPSKSLEDFKKQIEDLQQPITGLENIPKNNIGNLKDVKTGEIRTFATPEEGVAAVKSQLSRYMTKGSPITGEKVTSIKGVIDNWRPTSDRRGNKDISQENYYKIVSDILGVGINDPIEPTDLTLNKLTEAIAKVEHGKTIKLS